MLVDLAGLQEAHCIYAQVIALFHLLLLSNATLLPLRVAEADITGNTKIFRPDTIERTVVNKHVAAASSNSLDDFVIQDGVDRESIKPTTTVPTRDRPPMTIMPEVAYPQATGGKVDKTAIAVTTMSNEDGVLFDYYQHYTGSGTTDDGWPAKTSWISFAEMWANLE